MKHLLLFFILLSFETSAQDCGLIAWRFVSVPGDSNEHSIIFSATVAPGWHIFSQSIGEDGPLPTGISFTPSSDFVLLGSPIENGISVKDFDETFNMNLIYYSKSVSFTQRIKLYSGRTIVTGVIRYMLCASGQCTPPQEVPFKVRVDAPG
jgi:hypothetical protein